MKLKDWLSKARIAVAVGRTVMTGKHSRTFDRIDRGVEIAERTDEIANMVRDLLNKKQKRE